MRNVIQELMLLKRNIGNLCEQVERLESRLKEVAAPRGVLRHATADDIVPDAILWSSDGDDSWSYVVVGEVVRPSDPFNGFVSLCGNNYGFDGFFVECDNP